MSEPLFDINGITGRELVDGRLDLWVREGVGQLTPEDAAILGAHLQGWAVQHGVICETVMVPIEDGTEEPS